MGHEGLTLLDLEITLKAKYKSNIFLQIIWGNSEKNIKFSRKLIYEKNVNTENNMKGITIITNGKAKILKVLNKKKGFLVILIKTDTK